MKRNKRIFLLKVKFGLLVVLPAVTALLAAKTAQVWLGIKLREIKLPSEKPLVQPVHQETLATEFITPEPIDSQHNR